MKNVAIVDYGMGNLDSVMRAVEECGGSPLVISREKDFEIANYIILPGVGAFAMGMQNIRKRGLDKILSEQVIRNRIPFLGICLGMQLMASVGYEGGETRGLNWIKGEVRKLTSNLKEDRVPHMGWNEVVFSGHTPLFNGIAMNKNFYFVHRDRKSVV